ncbi:MAG: phytoene/squalene synthase family protein, partial [Nannocystaceae bacterium]
MPPLPESVACSLQPADVSACRLALAKGSKSFSAASWFLPPSVRDPAAVFYAFCRVADDLVDDSGDPHGAVTILRERLDNVFAMTPMDDPVDRSLAVIVRHYALPRNVFDALIDGFVWDATEKRYEEIDDTIAYAARVASTVGVIMTLLMGERDAHTLARACDLGVAMQLTNIARDVGEDARRGRVYLPARWLSEAEVSEEVLQRSPTFTPALGEVTRRLLDHAADIYARAEPGIPRLPRRCRAAIFAARLIYADIGRVIAARGYDSVSSRAVTSLPRKLWLMARALFRPVRPSPVTAPPLEEVAFLLTEIA